MQIKTVVYCVSIFIVDHFSVSYREISKKQQEKNIDTSKLNYILC